MLGTSITFNISLAIVLGLYVHYNDQFAKSKKKNVVGQTMWKTENGLEIIDSYFMHTCQLQCFFFDLFKVQYMANTLRCVTINLHFPVVIIFEFVFPWLLLILIQINSYFSTILITMLKWTRDKR